jgi:fructokinase
MIVVSGEALMDVFDAGATATGQALDARIGGSPLNVAIGLARLEQPVAFFGAVGAGFLGERLVRALADEGVETRAVRRVAAPTTLGLVGLDARGGADYAFYGGDAAAERQLRSGDVDALLATLRLAAADAFHFGSYAMVVEPVGSTLRELARRAAPGAMVAYDVNVRLRVEPDLARWHQVLDAMLPHTHLLKMSDEDFAHLFPGTAVAEADALAAQWMQRGVRGVVVTRGGEGATAWTPRGRIDVTPTPSAVVDTVGAGDSFHAALLDQLVRHAQAAGLRGAAALDGLSSADWQAALQFAARAAALTCSRRGADLPRRAELLR